MDELLPYLSQALVMLIFLVVPISGLVLCRKKLARSHPKACAHATTGWVLYMVHIVLGSGVTIFFRMHAVQSGNRLAYANWLTFTNLAASVILLASLLFLILAIIADRSAPEPR
jgi:hypothetical protein